MASMVWRRMALARPVFRMERFCSVMPIFSASCLERILRLASMTSMFIMIMVVIT